MLFGPCFWLPLEIGSGLDPGTRSRGLGHSRVWRLLERTWRGSKLEWALCILMPPTVAISGAGTRIVAVWDWSGCLCWCYFHCKQMMRNTQTHSDTTPILKIQLQLQLQVQRLLLLQIKIETPGLEFQIEITMT